MVRSVRETPRSIVTPSSAARSRSTASVCVCGMFNSIGNRVATSVSPIRASGAYPSGRGASISIVVCGSDSFRIRSSAPSVASISCVRGWTPTARNSVVGSGSASISRGTTPCRASSQAATRPTGPAPTTRTDEGTRLCLVAGLVIVRAFRRVWSR